MGEVEFKNVTKAFGETIAVDNIDLSIQDKSFLVLVGPSGCGKTTTLRMLAGLEDTSAGKILIDNNDITGLPPKDRDIAMVFQSYALYPHMNVYDNLAFGLRNRSISWFENTTVSLVNYAVWIGVVASICGLAYLLDAVFNGVFSMIAFGGILAFFLLLSVYPDFRKALRWKSIVFAAKRLGSARRYVNTECEIEKKVEMAARMLEIDPLLRRKPKQLSGGQRQRVALGRAIVREPKVFLMDEPLSNLDAKLRNTMRAELSALQSKLGVTTLYVTHDQVEAMTLGDEIAVMNNGIIEQVGTPEEVYNKPETRFVAGFIGTPSMNFFAGELETQNGKAVIQCGETSMVLGESTDLKHLSENVGKKVTLGIRPEHIKLAKPDEASLELKGEITFAEPIGAITHVFLDLFGDLQMTVAVEGYQAARRGTTVQVYLPSAKMHFFDESGQRL